MYFFWRLYSLSIYSNVVYSSGSREGVTMTAMHHQRLSYPRCHCCRYPNVVFTKKSVLVPSRAGSANVKLGWRWWRMCLHRNQYHFHLGSCETAGIAQHRNFWWPLPRTLHGHKNLRCLLLCLMCRTNSHCPLGMGVRGGQAHPMNRKKAWQTVYLSFDWIGLNIRPAFALFRASSKAGNCLQKLQTSNQNGQGAAVGAAGSAAHYLCSIRQEDSGTHKS